ncbi:MAG: asparagine--tRNA ligase [Flavobacteriaceae bacterium]|nr:asparagine--tRNA ligase [Flavobacteriaceae bacterium]|tara:strand:+ start:63162 stop:64568 length:1407 start_codon:yes stop_codon:yes gene_type:complete
MITKISNLISENKSRENIEISGWVKTFRSNRFIALNDGSTINNLQCIIEYEKFNSDILKKITTGASLQVSGNLVESKGKGQTLELVVNKLTILGESDPELYPIQPKKHSYEFLREKAHLRIRTTTFNAVMRIRSVLSFAVHKFFQERNFYYLNSPIITGSDAEGAGEMFRVSTLKNNNTDFKSDFFGKETFLTVSGQLEAESYALGLGDVYTFGPTFRAENSNTSRHLSEFWMIEPEMAFYDLNDNINLAEKFIKHILRTILNKCSNDLAFLDQNYINEQKKKPLSERSDMGLIEKIKFVVENNFMRISYTDAIKILIHSKPNKKKKFKYIIEKWGCDLQSEHERFLVEKHFKCPVVLFDYPAKIKAFYMRLNEDNKTVRAMDILFPGVGEIVGGSQREERLEFLLKRMDEMNINKKELWWYIDLRRFGSVPHSGFGLGFERIVQFATGMSNIRDVIPFPRTPQNAEF